MPCMSAGKDPTNIGSLRDSVNWGGDEDERRARGGSGSSAAMPKAKGLVKDTHDPRLGRSMAK